MRFNFLCWNRVSKLATISHLQNRTSCSCQVHSLFWKHKQAFTRFNWMSSQATLFLCRIANHRRYNSQCYPRSPRRKWFRNVSDNPKWWAWMTIVLVALDSAYILFLAVPNAFLILPTKHTEGRLGNALCAHGCLRATGMPTVFSERMARWHKAEEGAGMKALLAAWFSRVSQNVS